MSRFSEMEWNSKWDWENLVMCGSKSMGSPKKLQLADWMVVDDEETDAGSFNLSAGCGNSGASGSDSGLVYSAKSSISASTDSSTKDGVQTPSFKLMSFEGFSGEKMELKGIKLSGTSQRLDSSIGCAEQLIGLKLGKRTYFENGSGGGHVKNASYPVMPTSSAVSMKKTKSAGQKPPVPSCVVEGCNTDLSTAKEYHRKHRVCESHSKWPKVIVGGVECRFCQQCSRFHGLAEFDEKKRSCRRRLSDHNARRRKPKQETIQFSSTRLSSSPFCVNEGRQQMSFLLNNAPLISFRSPASTAWTRTCNSKFTVTKGYSNEDEGTDRQIVMPGIKLLHIPNILDNATNGPEGLNPDLEGPLISSSQEYSRALSLLSTNSWGSSCGPGSIPVSSIPVAETQPMMNTNTNTIPEGEFWPTTGHRIGNSNFQEMQLLKTAYDEVELFSNILN